MSSDLYADDTTLYMIGETQDYIEQNLQIALQNLSEWCKLDGMLLNTEKKQDNVNYHLSKTSTSS